MWCGLVLACGVDLELLGQLIDGLVGRGPASCGLRLLYRPIPAFRGLGGRGQCDSWAGHARDRFPD